MGGKAGGHTHTEALAQSWDPHLLAWTAEESLWCAQASVWVLCVTIPR